MGYELRALLGTAEILNKIKKYPTATLVHVHEHVYMIPFTDDLYDDINQYHISPQISNFIFMNERIASLLASITQSEILSYVEADYFGGIGSQHAIVWKNEQTLIKLKGNNSINHALHLLGITKEESLDEMDTAQLSRHRSTMDWLDYD